MSPQKSQKSTAAKLAQYRRQTGEDLEEDGCATQSGEERPAGDTDKLLEAITFCRISLTAQIEEVKVDISLIRQDLHKLRNRVRATETRISDVEDIILPLQADSGRMQQQIQQLFTKQDEMENRLRRCNLRLIGLPGWLKVGIPPVSY